MASSSNKISTTKVIHLDGTIEEYTSPIRAGQVASRTPGCYVYNSEAMAVGEKVPAMAEIEILEPGQLYFLMPLSKSCHPLTLHDLCCLAFTAWAALSRRSGSRRLGLRDGLVRCYGKLVCKSVNR